MSIDTVIFAALRGLVADKVYRETFPQTDGAPLTPAIRVTLVSGTTYPTVCGSDFEGDPRYQVDVIHDSAKQRDVLVQQIYTALDSVDPPAILQGLASNEFDTETKKYLATFDYIFFPSSVA